MLWDLFWKILQVLHGEFDSWSCCSVYYTLFPLCNFGMSSIGWLRLRPGWNSQSTNGNIHCEQHWKCSKVKLATPRHCHTNVSKVQESVKEDNEKVPVRRGQEENSSKLYCCCCWVVNSGHPSVDNVLIVRWRQQTSTYGTIFNAIFMLHHHHQHHCCNNNDIPVQFTAISS